MKARKPPILTAKDLANIRTLIQQECLQANKEVRKEIRELRKENMELRKQKKIDDAIMTDAERTIEELRDEAKHKAIETDLQS